MEATTAVQDPPRQEPRRKKMSMGALPRPMEDDNTPPLRRARSVDEGCNEQSSSDTSDRETTTPSPRETAIDKNLETIIECLTALRDNSPRGTELTRLLSRADAQVNNASIAVRTVYAMEGKMHTLATKLDALVAKLDVLVTKFDQFVDTVGVEPADSADLPHAEPGQSTRARYDTRNIIRLLHSTQELTTTTLSNTVALVRIEEKIDLIMSTVTRIPVIQRDNALIYESVERVADTLAAIEAAAKSPTNELHDTELAQ